MKTKGNIKAYSDLFASIVKFGSMKLAPDQVDVALMPIGYSFDEDDLSAHQEILDLMDTFGIKAEQGAVFGNGKYIEKSNVSF
jgi:hypothetical protein